MHLQRLEVPDFILLAPLGVELREVEPSVYRLSCGQCPAQALFDAASIHAGKTPHLIHAATCPIGLAAVGATGVPS